MSEVWHAIGDSIGFWTFLGSSIGVSLAYGLKRAIDWNWPPGHHSRRVQRYGVRDEDLDDEKESEE